MSRQSDANVTYSPFEGSPADILETYGQFDVVIEVAGTQSATDLCTDSVA